MKKIRIFIFLLGVSHFSFGQDVIEESKSILSFLIRDKRDIFLSSGIDTFSLGKVEKALSNPYFNRNVVSNGKSEIDTLFLSVAERKYIDSSLNNSKAYKWTKIDMQLNGLSRFTLIDSSQANRNPEFDFIRYQIIKPIFIRNSSFAFAYYDYACGGLCGQGELLILKKENGKWSRWISIYSFHS